MEQVMAGYLIEIGGGKLSSVEFHCIVFRCIDNAYGTFWAILSRGGTCLGRYFLYILAYCHGSPIQGIISPSVVYHVVDGRSQVLTLE